MKACRKRLTARSVSEVSHRRLAALRSHTRLTLGSLLDDAIHSLWVDYLNDGYDLPGIEN